MNEANSSINSESRSLWVLEGKIDLPTFFPYAPDETGKKPVGLFLDFSSLTGDGFLELKAVNASQMQESTWWSRSEPVLFEFRASVSANSMLEGWKRCKDFVEQMLDRVTFLAGSPATLIEVGFFYNESQLQECQKGIRSEYDCSTGGMPSRNTLPFANAHVFQQMHPSDRAKRALRWFRKAMTFENVEDRYLSYYFALECISNDIEETKVETHICQNCKQSTGIRKPQTDGIKALIRRHPELPKGMFRQLGQIRAKLVHGGDATAQGAASQLEHIVRGLAAEGIAISLGVHPDSIRVADTSTPVIYSILRSEYSEERDPSKKWGSTVLLFLERLSEPHGKDV